MAKTVKTAKRIKRNYYRTTYTVTVLSLDEPVKPLKTLTELQDLLMFGHVAGEYSRTKVQELSSKSFAKACAASGCQPEIFGLTKTGANVPDGPEDQ
jgi:hypothetical protein